jgi:pimeloyl-ACP methyl ester carboxylesterase
MHSAFCILVPPLNDGPAAPPPCTLSGMPTGESTRDVSARNVRLRVVEYGSGPTLVLLHGFLMTHLAWEDIAERLADRFHVVVPDLPGFGDSEKPSPTRFDYGVEAFAECVADLIAALSLGRPHVVGHGMSGAIAMTLAAEHPELLDRLVLVDPLVYPLARKGGLFEMPVLGGFFFKQLYGRSLFRNYFRDSVFSPGFPVPLERIDHFYEAFNSPPARESAFATMHALLDTRSTVARMSKVTAKTFVVWGRHDALYPSQLGQRLAREIGAEHLLVMETGHAPYMERPDDFVSSLTRFLLPRARRA